MIMRLNDPQQETGMALIISLVFLVIVTLLGMTVMNVSTLQEKMAAGTRDKDMAFQAAEMALRKAEVDIENNIVGSEGFTDACASGKCTAMTGAATAMRWADPDACGTGVDIWQCNKSTAVNLSSLAGDALDKSPRYFIEVVRRIRHGEELMLGNIGDGSIYDSVMVYRITAIGYGGSSESKVVLQSTYGKVQ